MRKIILLLLLILLHLSCKEKKANSTLSESKIEFNQKLADELSKMSESDQLAARNAYPPTEYRNMTQKQWESFKDSIFRANQKRLDEILNNHGYPGYNLVGEEGSQNFWLMTQHSDHNPEFQKRVLKRMKIEVQRNNAHSRHYGLLIDRVNLNIGQPQIYGTQVAYNPKTGQAYPRKLKDSINVDKRRKLIGLSPLNNYLNKMTQMHFQMNKEIYLQEGIKKPVLYQTK